MNSRNSCRPRSQIPRTTGLNPTLLGVRAITITIMMMITLDTVFGIDIWGFRVTVSTTDVPEHIQELQQVEQDVGACVFILVFYKDIGESMLDILNPHVHVLSFFLCYCISVIAVCVSVCSRRNLARAYGASSIS